MKVAVFGAGRIGQIHAANAAALPGVELVAVSDPVAESATALAQKVGAKVSDIDSILNDKSIEAVIIGSPTTTHSDLISRSAAAGKQIFCEKPVDLSVTRAQECQRLVEQANVACMIGFNRRFDPTFYAAKARIDTGEIGTPELVIITSRDPGAPPVSYIKQSGGIFRDMAIHDFDMARWLLDDEVVSVHATGSCLVDPEIAQAGDIDTAVINLRTAKGRLCQINNSRRAIYGYDQRFEVMGAKGMLQCGNQRPTEVVAWNTQGVAADLPEHFFLERYKAAYRLELEHFFDCLATGKAFRTTIKDGVEAQKLADAAAQSYAENRIVSLA